jgi:hypothetical protein
MGAFAMRQSLIVRFAVVGLALAVGCGSKPESTPTSTVFNFFDAVRQGNTAQAQQQLTPVALQRITELDMSIAPPGSATASFKVNGITQEMGDHALVSVTWTDLDPDGKPQDEPILIEVRNGDGQWRICGMAQDRGPGLAPMVLDFETMAPSKRRTAATTPAGAAVAPVTAATAGAVAPAGAAAPSQPVGPVAQDPFLQQR